MLQKLFLNKLKYMKRIMILFVSLIALASCMMDTTTQQSYTLVATFEYSVDFGEDSLYFDTKYGQGIGWDDLAFLHKLDEDRTEFTGGFLLSQLKSTEDTALDSTWRVVQGRGYGSSETYLVYHSNQDKSMMPEHDALFITKDYGTCAPSGCYVNNTALVASKVRSTFEIGDRLVLKAVGYVGEKKTGETEILLADYSAQQDSVMTAWTPFELNKLGTVETIDFELISTRPEVPLYVCIDNFVASVALEY